ncbi:MAG: substrate-binding domain-containing protein [Chloroflexi bacterium]|nr:substrate-binding domain-containing protein [Chloroflexota bacterium]
MSQENHPTGSPRLPRAPRPAPPEKPRAERRRGCLFSTPFLVFIGTLAGSLLGVGANIADIIGATETIQDWLNPPVELCIAGSNTILGEGINVAADWKTSFEELHNVSVRIEGVGSVRGVEMAARGECVHVLAMSEPMTDVQYNQLTGAGVQVQCAAEIGYDVVAFVTDIENTLSTINIRDLDNILIGSIREWGELPGSRRTDQSRPIYLLARPGSGTTEFVLINVARYTDPDPNDNQYFPPDANYIPCPSNDACLDLTLSTLGSLYWVSSAWMRTQPPEYLRIIPILQGDEAPINPLTQDVDLDEYPVQLIRPLYLYVLGGGNINPQVSELANEFLTYVRSVRGQQVLEKYYFYTHFDKPAEIAIPLPPGFEIPAYGPRTICK